MKLSWHEASEPDIGLLADWNHQIWPRDVRLTVDVLCHNQGGVAFWRGVGYRDYSLTLEIMPRR